MNIGRIIVTDTPLPGSNTASWPKLITQLLELNECRIDAIISPPSILKLQSDHVVFYCDQKPNKFLNKLKLQKRYRHYFSAIKKLLKQYDLLILCIIDSTRVKNEVYDFLQENGLHHKVRIMFYFHGHSYFFSKQVWERFANGINHFVFLTRVSYEYHLAHCVSLPFAVSVLHNPVNKLLFNNPSSTEKTQLRQSLGWNQDVLHYVWLSHNRPKKGFEVVLSAWTEWVKESNPKAQLHVIGIHSNVQIDNVEFLGLIDNNQVPKYLRAADIGLFSSLVQEGFPLSLMEMMSCGCYCIASQVGGVKEFFVDEKHGIAMTHPNEIHDWVAGFNRSLKEYKSWESTKSDQSIFLDLHSWSNQFSKIFTRMETAIKFSSFH